MSRYTAIVLLIGVLILTTLLSTFLSYRSAERAAEDFLKSQALGIAASLETTLARYGTGENIFADIIQSEQWEAIAYLALYGRDGTVLLHSNRNLIGRISEEPGIRDAFLRGGTSYAYNALQTGETVFVLDTMMHFGSSERILRVALHTYPSEKIIRGARFQLWSVAAVVLVLSLVTVFSLISAKKRTAMQKTLEEKEKLSLLGEMSAVLAHEIRNPLGSIKGCAQYLRELNANKGTEEENKGYYDVMVAESLRLEKLTEDLLSYTRAQDLQSENFRLSELVRETVQSLVVPPSVEVHNRVGQEIALTTDKGKLMQIVANLLQNAIDAIHENGSVIVDAEEQGKIVSLTVSDTGSGIDDKARPQIFRPFFTTKAKGTGLGLAVVDRYVHALGGKMRFESVVGSGSTFTVAIPAETGKKGNLTRA